MVPFDDGVQLAVADIPGIIPGAHQDKGLGIEFLRHIERCACLLYVIDMSQPSPHEQYETLLFELGQYREDLPNRSHAIVANKMDEDKSRANMEDFKEKIKSLAINNPHIFEISAKYGDNIHSLLGHIRRQYDQMKEETLSKKNEFSNK